MADFAGDARSPAGHAAFSMRGTDDRWVLIQVNTFTNWVNEQLKSKDMRVDDLRVDLSDGIRLSSLMEVLQKKTKIGRVIRKPLNQHHYLENVTLAINAMQNDGIKLVNIGSEDIVNGNLKLILGMVWSLILRYQIGRASKVPPRKLMLAWLNAVIPECKISNFNTDWNDGRALHALIEYCKPGTCPNWRQLGPTNGLANCQNAMQLAKKHFDIPMILTPENMASPDLDELSGMTYLSYFMKVNSPGYQATLKYVKEKIPGTSVGNFQTDWNDGSVLAALVTACGGHVTELNKADWVGNIQKSLTAAEQDIGVQPVISAREMADVEVDHLGVMAYAAWFQKYRPSPQTVAPSGVTQLVSGAPPNGPAPPPPPPRPPPSQTVTLTQVQKETLPNNLSPFTIELLDEAVDKNGVHVEVIGPSTKPAVTLSWHGPIGYGHFTPAEPGPHQIFVYNEGQLIDGCPQNINVKADRPLVHLTESIPTTCNRGNPVTIKIDAATAHRDSVRVEARAPSGRIQEMGIGETNGVYTANFTPDEVGVWRISINYDGRHIQGSPFNVRVYDAAQVKVYGLEGGAVGRDFSFSADCSNAGDGQLTVEIKHNGHPVPVNIAPNTPGKFDIRFTPEGPGIYTIRVYFAGMEVAGSPYTLEIVDSHTVKAEGEGLASIEVNRRAHFRVHTQGGGSSNDIRVNITSPRGQSIPCQIYNNGDGTFRCEYEATEVGDYLVHVLYYGKDIKGSPFTAHAFDWNRIAIKNLRTAGAVGKAVEFDIDASQAGSGNLEIMVNEGTIPCSVQNRGHRQFQASFMPKEPIAHHIQMKFNGREVPGSPWRVDIRSAAHISASGRGLQMVPARVPASFDVQTGGTGQDGSLVTTVLSPSGRRLPVHIVNNYNGVYRMEYTATEVGNHTIEVLYDGMAIPGSPFTAKVYDSSAIVVSPIPNSIVGKETQFTIDVTQGGEGQLEIMVNRGSVPNTVKMLRKGVFVVSFVPRDTRQHQVDIKFNGELLSCCPMMVPSLDASRVTVHGDGLRQVAVNRSSYFRVNTQSAGDADLSVRVTSPTGRNVPVNQSGSPSKGYDVQYALLEVGTHRLDIEYAEQPVSGSPFFVKAFNPAYVKVHEIKDGVVGQRSTFRVDVNEAGEGNMEIALTDRGRNIQNQVRQLSTGQFEVAYTPLEASEHTASITFNGEHVPGSPFSFKVVDASKVMASGEGLGLVPVNKKATFMVQAETASQQDLDIRITDPRGYNVKAMVAKRPDGEYSVDYVPSAPGEHKINITYMKLPINGSPFTARAWDAGKVVVTGIKAARKSKPFYFYIDASSAGAGNLEIIVSVRGENVPNFVKSKGNAHFEVSFTPQVPDTHMLSVKFNGEPVPGSPFYCSLIDGKKATARGDGLYSAAVKKQGRFNVDTHDLGEAELEVELMSPSGHKVPCRWTGSSHAGGFAVEYVPQEVGQHRMKVMYADIEIKDSPFFPQVFDLNLCKVDKIPNGVVHKPLSFQVDAAMAGEGQLAVEIFGKTTNPIPSINQKGSGMYEVSFTPEEIGDHTIHVTYNGMRVPDSPFTTTIIDVNSVQVNLNAMKSVPVNQPAHGMVDPGNTPDAPIEVKIMDPYERQVPSRITRQGAQSRIEFIPMNVGAHWVYVSYAGQPVPGSPFVCLAYDSSKVRIIDVNHYGAVNQELGFTVDSREAGSGDIDFEVTSNGQLVPTSRHILETNVDRFTYIPKVGKDHSIDVSFNYQSVTSPPIVVKVTDPGTSLVVGPSLQPSLCVNQPGWSVIHTHGASIDHNKLHSSMTAPNGELVPANMVTQPDGDFKVEYSSKYTGRHTVEIMYAGQAIMGSPFFVEIYDPNKIRVEGVKNGIVDQTIGFDILRHEAGKAELGLTITAPSGHSVPYQSQPTAHGDHIVYTPHEVGQHLIYLTYGGLEVPGCPLTQNITDGGSVDVFGDGLTNGIEGKPAVFYVDPKGKRGDLWVQVDGPNSIAKCNIEPDNAGRYSVSYIPVESGVYVIHVKWNGRPVPGSPFHPNIVDTSKVVMVGGWQSLLDAHDKMSLTVNEVKRIEFNTSAAGAGVLTAELRGPGGTIVPCELERVGDGRYIVSCVPRMEGEHFLSVWLSKVLLPRFPIAGYAYSAQASINSEKVILTGHGLQTAQIRNEAEFVIDGTEAGPGQPEVKLTGVKEDISVSVSPLAGRANCYRCSYIPRLAGAYLLNIMWSDRQVRGSPFKVTVSAGSDATKVLCSGEGLKVGIMGKEIKSVIDTRRAGPGELEAHCMGPKKVAYCELFDHHDGTFTLNIKPQEPGRHILQVKYGGEHVPGSPYTLRVSSAPDASKVRVSGPGIEHGILAMFQSYFTVETRGAGAGQLTVRIRGPKGAFRVEMSRDSQKDRTIRCNFDPTEVGDYVIYVKWSGEEVPGSPYRVQIFDTQEELEAFMVGSGHRLNTLPSTNRSWESRTFDM